MKHPIEKQGLISAWLSAICYTFLLFSCLSGKISLKWQRRLPGGLWDRQVPNTLWRRRFRIALTPEPDGETEAVLGGWDPRGTRDSPWQHRQGRDPSDADVVCKMNEIRESPRF